MQSNPDIIYFTLFPWDNAYSSVSLSFTSEFVKNNRVFYINHPYTMKDFITGWNDPKVKARAKDMLLNRMRYETIPGLPEVIAVHPPLTVPVNWMKPGRFYERFYQFNNKIIVNTIRRVIKDFDLKDYIYINCFNPYYAGVLPKELKPALNIYQCIDDMTQDKYTARHGARVEEEVIRQADIAIVTSKNLYRLKKHLNPNIRVVHNAVDIGIFREATERSLLRPEEIKNVTGKIIGFTGNLDEYRIDFPLLGKIAERHVDKTLVLVGPLNSDGYIRHGLDKMPNVILTGGKHITELPAFLQHFDVTIIPFLCNKLTASIYPLKINEYLAAGKPVVATNFSEDIRSFTKDIYIAKDEEDFIQLLDKAIQEDTQNLGIQRIATANSNTWEARVKQFWGIVNEHLESKKMNSTSLTAQPG